MVPGLKATNPELKVGDMAPVFNANNQDGELWSIADFKDKNFIVIYFYPAALTSGCTKQACSYRDNRSKLNEIDVEIDLNRPHTVSRWTYIIDKSGKIVYKDTKVSAKEDSDKVIDFLNKQFEK